MPKLGSDPLMLQLLGFGAVILFLFIYCFASSLRFFFTGTKKDPETSPAKSYVDATPREVIQLNRVTAVVLIFISVPVFSFVIHKVINTEDALTHPRTRDGQRIMEIDGIAIDDKATLTTYLKGKITSLGERQISITVQNSKGELIQKKVELPQMQYVPKITKGTK
jgi:hypothetical protein